MMRIRRTNISTTIFITVALSFLGCGAGPYGFARYYVPLDQEESYHEQSEAYTLGAVTARPQDYKGRLIGWFGVVKNVQATKDGRSLIQLAFHKHKTRHLCEGETASTCRVTVNHRSTGSFSAAVMLSDTDKKPGLDKVQPGTLMRVFGQIRCIEDDNGDPRCDRDKNDNVILYCDYYRQWPARYYRTTRSANKMVR